MVPVAGVEPARTCVHGILSPGRLPIPPHRRVCRPRRQLVLYRKQQRKSSAGLRFAAAALQKGNTHGTMIADIVILHGV